MYLKANQQIHSQSPLIQRDGGVGVSLAAQLDVLSAQVPVSIKPFDRHLRLIWWGKKINHLFIFYLDCSVWERLTLYIEGDAVRVHLLVVNSDTGERLPVGFFAWHQDIVTLDGDGPVWVYVLSGGHLSGDPRLPPAHNQEDWDTNSTKMPVWKVKDTDVKK